MQVVDEPIQAKLQGGVLNVFATKMGAVPQPREHAD